MAAELTKLNFEKLGLQGRLKEVESLRKACQETIDISDAASRDKPVQICLVKGPSGVGKSTLISCIVDPDHHEAAICGSGKFEQRRDTEPYFALVRAFNALCDRMIYSSRRDEFRRAIQEAVGTEGQVVIDLIPQMAELLTQVREEADYGDVPTTISITRTRTEAIGVAESLVQLKYRLRLVMEAVTQIQPVIMVLDDLQWADQASLDLITSIATYSKLSNFGLIGAYRDNQIDDKHPWFKAMEQIRNHQNTSVTDIQIGSFDQDTVNKYVANLLGLDPDMTIPLSELVYSKTKGNVFFVRQLLELLVNKKLLYYSFHTYRWEWNVDRAREEVNISDNVVDLVVGKIQRHTTELQNVLKTAAALSARFDLNVLQAVLLDLFPNAEWMRGDRLHQGLQLAVSDGLLESAAGPTTISMESSRDGEQAAYSLIPNDLLQMLMESAQGTTTSFRFAHDRIQQAAYSLIPDGVEREKIHLSIGLAVLNICNNTDTYNPQMLFVAADQMNLGSDHLVDKKSLLELANLNLQVGLNAKRVSAFFPACQYFSASIALLGENAWEEHHDLALQLHLEAMEVNESCGEIEKAMELADIVLLNSDSPANHRAYVSKEQCLSSQKRLLEAIVFGRKYILKLGEKLPKKVGLFSMIKSMMRTKKKLKSHSNEDILALQRMTNQNAINACTMYQKMATTCFFLDRTMDMAFMLFRIVQLTIKHGIGELSPFGFGTVGFVLTGMGEVKEGCRLGNLALAMLDKVETEKYKPMTICMVHAYIMPWQQPLQDSLEPLLKCYRLAMQVGDTQYSASTVAAYMTFYGFCGLPLGNLDRDLVDYNRHVLDYKQEHMAECILAFQQGIRNLIVKRYDPVCLDGDLLTEEDFVKRNLESDNSQALLQFYLGKFVLAFYFDRLDEAIKNGDEFHKRSEPQKGHNQYWLYMFVKCLVHVSLHRRTKKRKHRSEALKAAKEIEKWVKLGNVNVVHKLMIVKAEILSLTGKASEIKESFEKAIAASSRVGFVQDAALGAELLGKFYKRKGDNNLAADYLVQAYGRYMSWGAYAKALHLKCENAWILETFSSMPLLANSSWPGSQESSGQLRGKTTYDRSVLELHRNLKHDAPLKALRGSVTSETAIGTSGCNSYGGFNSLDA